MYNGTTKNKQLDDKLLARYDLDNSGAIDKDEMVNVMKSIYSMVDGNIADARRGNTNDKVSLELSL